jgi:hypothetical protein
MAKIQYSSASPKAGQIEHVSSSVAATLCAAGFATAVPFPPRGSKDWLAAIQELDRLNTQPSQYDVVPEAPTGISWAVKKTDGGKVVIIRRTMEQVDWLSAPTPDTPQNIAQQFREMSGDDEAVAIANEKQKNAVKEVMAQEKAGWFRR